MPPAARRPPATPWGRGVSQVDRVKVHPDPGGHGRQAGRRRRERAADLAGKGQAGSRRAEGPGPDPVPVAVQLQPEPGPGAQIDQGPRAAGSGAGRRDAQDDLGAAGHLVHLIPAPLAQHGDVVQARRAERTERGEERLVEPRLGRAGLGEVPRQAGTGRSRRTRNAIAALPSSAGSRSAGNRASRLRRSSSAAIASNNAAVSRHDRGASGCDQPRATSSAWPRTSSAPGTPAPQEPASRTQPPKAQAVPHSPHRDHLATVSRHPHAGRGEPAINGQPAIPAG